MRIALVAGGRLPIPPKDWGAVEGIVWHMSAQLRRHGHHVDVFNTDLIHDVIHGINDLYYDFVHCHTELFALPFNKHLRRPYALTSHFGGLHQYTPQGRSYPSFTYLFKDALEAPAAIVLSDRIRDLYLSNGYTGFLRVLRNGVEAGRFRVAPRGNGRAICLGRIAPRKRQAFLADVTRGHVSVDFVGPWAPAGEPRFQEGGTVRYLGVWDKATLYDQLTDYSCLILLSESEASPLVVLEALAAGVSVVISEACTANLTDEAFITVVHERWQPEDINAAIAAAIDRNDELRPVIRQYACDRFDYTHLVTDYLRIIADYRRHFAGRMFRRQTYASS